METLVQMIGLDFVLSFRPSVVGWSRHLSFRCKAYGLAQGGHDVHVVCRKRVALSAAALALIFTPVLFGQANTGTILGTVTDSSGAAVPNCKITVRNTGTDVAKEVRTDSSGNYRVSYLLPGVYEVLAEAPNFKRSVQSGLTLDVDQKALVSFTLDIGAVSEKVDVVASAPLVQTQSWSKAR